MTDIAIDTNHWLYKWRWVPNALTVIRLGCAGLISSLFIWEVGVVLGSIAVHPPYL